VNIVSQMVHRLGFIWLILIPHSLKGRERGPRIGMGMRMCCQHPTQMRDFERAMTLVTLSHWATHFMRT
jgi:hypothetical protein